LTSLKLEPVYFNTELSEKTFNYLKNQKYIEYKKIKIFIENKFCADHPYGFLIVDSNSNIYGFLGTMFSNRTNKDFKKYIFCNLHTWIVDKKYRINFFSNAKKILQPIFDYNCVFFAKPVGSLIRMFERNFSMINIEMNLRLAFLPKLNFLFNQDNYEITTNQKEIEKRLSPEDLQIYLDHKKFSCYKFLIKKKNTQEQLFIIAQKTRKKFYFSFLELIYVSDPILFKNLYSEISIKLAKTFKVLFLGQNFLEESQCSIPKNRIFFHDFKQQIVVKNMPKLFRFNSLYTEFVH
jgi:hypothetical protein